MSLPRCAKLDEIARENFHFIASVGVVATFEGTAFRMVKSEAQSNALSYQNEYFAQRQSRGFSGSVSSSS